MSTNNWSVFDAKVRERVGHANVHRCKRRTQDTQQQPQIGAFVVVVLVRGGGAGDRWGS
jgi:hypothetical protein